MVQGNDSTSAEYSKMVGYEALSLRKLIWNIYPI